MGAQASQINITFLRDSCSARHTKAASPPQVEPTQRPFRAEVPIARHTHDPHLRRRGRRRDASAFARQRTADGGELPGHADPQGQKRQSDRLSLPQRPPAVTQCPQHSPEAPATSSTSGCRRPRITFTSTSCNGVAAGSGADLYTRRIFRSAVLGKESRQPETQTSGT